MFKINSKDTRATSGACIVNFNHILQFILPLLLLNQNKCYETLISDSKFVFNNFDKCIILSAGKICWATCFHLYSPNIKFQNDTFSRQYFKKVGRTLIYIYGRRYLFQIYISLLQKFLSNCSVSVIWFVTLFCQFSFLKFLKLPSLYETFRDSRCYIWCCKKGQDRMIGLTSSGRLATTSMDNFPCLLIFNFKYTALFCNIFDTEVMVLLAKISICIFF